MSMESVKRSLSQAWENLAEGWHRLRDGAYGAMTRFRHQNDSNDTSGNISVGWGLLAAEIKEQGDKLLVRLEVPGMESDGFDIDVDDDLLTIRGEKKVEKSSEQGVYMVRECAYGRFERQLPLPMTVVADGAKASYRQGVLNITLKKKAQQRRRIEVNRA